MVDNSHKTSMSGNVQRPAYHSRPAWYVHLDSNACIYRLRMYHDILHQQTYVFPSTLGELIWSCSSFSNSIMAAPSCDYKHTQKHLIVRYIYRYSFNGITWNSKVLEKSLLTFSQARCSAEFLLMSTAPTLAPASSKYSAIHHRNKIKIGIVQDSWSNLVPTSINLRKFMNAKSHLKRWTVHSWRHTWVAYDHWHLPYWRQRCCPGASASTRSDCHMLRHAVASCIHKQHFEDNNTIAFMPDKYETKQNSISNVKASLPLFPICQIDYIWSFGFQ